MHLFIQIQIHVQAIEEENSTDNPIVLLLHMFP